jgi:polar amino acid transport system substrate-binding protein
MSSSTPGSGCSRSALTSRSKLVLLDEPSMRLAPVPIQQIIAIIAQISQQGTTILLVEPNAHRQTGWACSKPVEISGPATAPGRLSRLVREDVAGMLKITRAAVGIAGAAVLTLSMVAACGDSNTGGNGTTVPSTVVDQALAAKVPASIKAAGKITIGSDATYAPSEFLDTDGKTVIGFDVDLFNAVAAKLGLKTDWQPSSFDSIVSGVGTGKYDIGVSSFTVNADRLKEVTMVTYFNAGTQWAAAPGNTIDPNNACGKKIAVQTATVQDDDITAKSKACTAAGKAAITIDHYQAQSDATNAVISGKDDAMLADSPVIAYAVKKTEGQLVTVGAIYDSAPYGYALPKDQTEFGQAIADAVKALIADGTYKSVLDKWGVTGGSITDPTVNPNLS